MTDAEPIITDGADERTPDTTLIQRKGPTT